MITEETLGKVTFTRIEEVITEDMEMVEIVTEETVVITKLTLTVLCALRPVKLMVDVDLKLNAQQVKFS